MLWVNLLLAYANIALDLNSKAISRRKHDNPPVNAAMRDVDIQESFTTGEPK